MDIIDIIKKRRSIRRFKSDKIPEDVLYEMLEAARLASGGNAQTHCFGIIDDPDL